LVVALSVNAAGSVAVLAIVGWLATRPPTTMIHDTGTEMAFYQPASADIAPMNWRWQELMRTLGLQSAASDRAFLDLVARYTAPGRFYHNLGHVESMLITLDEAQDLARDVTTLQLAAWFHDVIYDLRAKDNEIRSGRYAERVLVDLGLPPASAARVCELIVFTRDHIAPDGDVDAAVLLDADLASFANEPAVFERQSELIRQEFSWMPDGEYYPARMRFLTTFLSRPRIYHTERMYREREARARENITRHLATLASLAAE
jgi:predicted metal-dependent HD superfamily phosphohydrolase